jgi:hypothetical protein
MPARGNRQKISTTIAPENAAYLKSMLKCGKAGTMAEAVDRAISVARRAEARARLDAATEAYFSSLSREVLEEENRLGAALSDESGHVNFDE